jgi:hypothetical protein
MKQTKLTADVLLARIHDLLDMVADENALQDAESFPVIQNCYAGAVSLYEAVYGPKSVQVDALQATQKPMAGYSPLYQGYLSTLKIKGALQNLQQEIALGLVGTLATQTAGEIFGDFLAAAKSARAEGHTSVAAVLAVAALEDGLKRVAATQGINTENKSIDAVINSLKAASFFKGAQSSIVGSYVKLRNLAMHAEWDKIQDADVGSLIGFLESFLLENFS